MIIRSTALALPLRDACVDLIVTSPPYFALRSYRDGDEHYAGQLGSEETPAAFVDALIEATREMVRVLKPEGSIFVNLGDKYAGSGGHNNNGLGASTLKHDGRARPKPDTDRQIALAATRRNAPDRYNQNSGGIPAKSLMGLPWRYANAVVDHLGLILRAEIIWSKPNGLPESVTDRVRRSHEQWFHFTKSPRYFSAVDEIREAYAPASLLRYENPTPTVSGKHPSHDHKPSSYAGESFDANPLGKFPGSVWTIPSEPLTIPDWARHKYNLPDHFAAFPQEWPRRLILGWSPTGICTKCGEGRRPVVDKTYNGKHEDTATWVETRTAERGWGDRQFQRGEQATISGYACACDVAVAPTRPSVVLDPFGGTGTVAMVARALGRTGLNGELSGDYGRLARWRIYESGHAAKSEDRTWRDAQGSML